MSIRFLIPEGSRSSLPASNIKSDECLMEEEVETTCNIFIQEFPAYNFKNWREYYLAWAKLDGTHPNEKSCFTDPHVFLADFPHWTIKYHPDSLIYLKKNEKQMKKIIECVLRLSCGNFTKRIMNKEYFKIMEQTITVPG